MRAKRRLNFGNPEESITAAKKEQLIAIAWHYQQTLDQPPPLWHIDVVAVELNQQDRPLGIKLMENAITGD